MKRKTLFNLFNFIVWLTFLISPAKSASLLDFELSDLREKGQVSLRDLVDTNKQIPAEKQIFLMSFFEPDCSWCNRQMKVFNKLQSACSQHVQPIAIGVHGNSRELKKDLRKAKVSYPAFAASSELLREIPVPATPWTLMLDGNGELVTVLRGYVPLEDFVDVFKHECDFSNT